MTGRHRWLGHVECELEAVAVCDGAKEDTKSFGLSFMAAQV